MIGVTVVVPWRAGHPQRERVWDWCRQWWRQALPVAELVESDSPGEWCKAAAVNAGVERASGPVVIVADADVIFHPGSLGVRVRRVAQREAPWEVPHGSVRRLDEQATRRLLGRSPTGALPKSLAAGGLGVAHRGMPGGGLFVIRKDDFLDIGGMDPAFDGYGGEDSAFGRYADTLIGVHERGSLPLYHLFHGEAPPRPGVISARYEPENVVRTREYQKHIGRPLQMMRMRPDIWSR